MPDNILFSQDPAADLAVYLKRKSYSSIGVVTDNNTLKHCYPKIKGGLLPHSVCEVKSGEENKTLKTCEKIWQFMTDQQFDRHALLIILGGGVLGDMAGFCAATYKRGIDFVLIPTTLLSQVDASIGGKLGVDFNNYKNHIGVFQLPALTLLHTGFLDTLPFAEKRSGYAEIVKHILISDAEWWKKITDTDFEVLPWEELIRQSVNFKSKVVEEDPKEKGLRKILNTGHTIGHAIETHLLNTNRKIMHGEAVAAGIITEGYLAYKRNMLTDEELKSISSYLLKIFGKVNINKEDDNEISSLTLQDKKNKGNKILCVMLDGVGKARWDYEVPANEVIDALNWYRKL